MLFLTWTVTIIMYVVVAYLSYLSVSMVYIGCVYQLPITGLKGIVFLLTCYLFLLADAVLFHFSTLDWILYKNAGFLVLTATGIIYTYYHQKKKT